VVRAAVQLSRPMTELAEAANRVAQGKLDEAVPDVTGPVEIVGLGQSIERMRARLARTIAELEKERAGLEANVEARTAELRKALDELRHAQAALVQGERLASIGELVSGVAHEIYNPLNAIAGASAPLEQIATDLRSMMAEYRAAEADLPEPRRRSVEKLRESIDLDASLEDLIGIATVVRRATDRSVKIVQNLKNFSRVSGEAVPSDLHAGLEETLMLLAPRLRQANIQLVKSYGELPMVTCRPGEVNQVFMNLLVNAIQAFDQEGAPPEPTIRIETWVEGEMAAVAVTDNGPGVPKHLERRIFDPFFTTKPRGQGTGLGLSISTDIARRHGGSLTLEAPRDGSPGSRFICLIPLKREASRSNPGL
jgi:two-component system, NtrC family, sensor kinase